MEIKHQDERARRGDTMVERAESEEVNRKRRGQMSNRPHSSVTVTLRAAECNNVILEG